MIRSDAADEHARATPGVYAALAAGVLAVSMGAILVRYAQQEAPSLTIAAYRTGIAFVVVLIPTALFRREDLSTLRIRDAVLAATSGFFLAVHFAAWIASLEMTSVAISVVLVNTAPLWVAVLAPTLARESLSRTTVLSIAISVTGAAAIGWGFDRRTESDSDLLGGALAILGAAGLAGYLLIGRNLRRRHGLGVYVTICYGAAAAYLWIAVLLSGVPFVGFSTATWGYLVGLALISQVIGHTTTNWALRFFAASMIAVVLLAEPVCSSLMAYILFGETLTVPQLVGAGLILIGIYLAARAHNE